MPIWDKQPLISGAGWSNEVVQWQAGRSRHLVEAPSPYMGIVVPIGPSYSKITLIRVAGGAVVQWQAGRSSTSGGIISLYGHPHACMSIGSIFIILSKEPWCKGKQVEQETV